MNARFSWPIRALVLLAVLFPAYVGLSAPSYAASARGGTLTMPHLVTGFGHVPLSFEPNVGQSDPAVRFLTHGNGYTLFLADSGPVMSLALPATAKPATAPTLHARFNSPPSSVSAVMTLRLLGANPHPRLVGED